MEEIINLYKQGIPWNLYQISNDFGGIYGQTYERKEGLQYEKKWGST